MTNVLDYYFIKEFQWHKKWFSENGISKPIIRASNDMLKKEFVDFSILEGIFHPNKKFHQSKLFEQFIRSVKDDLKNDGNSYVGNEIVGLKINRDYSKPIDHLGSNEGLEAPLSWNISTPEHLQQIPTQEILCLFDDWLDFLKVIEENPLRVS